MTRNELLERLNKTRWAFVELIDSIKALDTMKIDVPESTILCRIEEVLAPAKSILDEAMLEHLAMEDAVDHDRERAELEDSAPF